MIMSFGQVLSPCISPRFVSRHVWFQPGQKLCLAFGQSFMGTIYIFFGVSRRGRANVPTRTQVLYEINFHAGMLVCHWQIGVGVRDTRFVPWDVVPTRRARLLETGCSFFQRSLHGCHCSTTDLRGGDVYVGGKMELCCAGFFLLSRLEDTRHRTPQNFCFKTGFGFILWFRNRQIFFRSNDWLPTKIKRWNSIDCASLCFLWRVRSLE